MTQIKPVFVSAPMIKIRIGTKDIAYAIGINLNINIDVQSAYAFGEYGPVSLEPLMYGIVTGTLQITKLASKRLKGTSGEESILKQRQEISETIKQSGKGKTGGVFTEGGEFLSQANSNSGNSPLSIDGLYKHLDPGLVLASETFDLSVRLSHKTSDDDVEIDNSLLEVSKCRLSGTNINISLGSLVNEPVSFQGLLLIDKEKGVGEKLDFARSDAT